MDTELSNQVKAENYADLLLQEGIIVRSLNQAYNTIGYAPSQVDWAIHLSISIHYIPTMLLRVVPMIKSMGLYVTLPKDEITATQILNGELGIGCIGKVISFYAQDGNKAAALYSLLSPLTEGLAGPKVLTAAPLGGILYTQYVGREKYRKSMWPYPLPMPVPEKQKKLLFNNRYKIFKSIKADLKGDVFLGVYMKGFLRLDWCIIKEGHKEMKADIAKRSIKERLQWQMKIQQELSGIINVPKVLDICYVDGDTYLIMEYINGKSFDKLVPKLYGIYNFSIPDWLGKLKIIEKMITAVKKCAHPAKSWPQFSIKRQEMILNWLIIIASDLQKLHERGYIHRDLKPHNFLMGAKDKIYFIDMELSYSYLQKYPLPAFSLGTYGYMSPEQARNEEPTVKEDSWGFGGIVIHFLTGNSPYKYRYRDPASLAEDLQPLINNNVLIDLIVKCYQHDPLLRPDITQIKATLLEVCFALR